MLHTKFQGHRSIGSEEDFLKVFTINGHLQCQLGRGAVHSNSDYLVILISNTISMLHIFGSVFYIAIVKFCENHNIIRLSMNV